MVIEQTVDIPENHRVFLDLPLDLPVGRAKIAVYVTPEQTGETAARRARALAAIEKCCGIAQGSGLTSDKFLEMKRAERGKPCPCQQRW